ncbi:MAG TPA: response regulator transcription factor [Ktedonobacteraceae bacterium]|nr:response regulator transcription factor [Ktedonobacteraceae bacterium]
MIRVFVIAPTPMMRVGLSTILSHQDMQVVGEAAVLTGPTIELSVIDVIVLAGEELLEDLQHHVVEGPSPVLVVLSSNTIRLPVMLNTLSPQGWGIVQPDASAAQLQVAVLAAAQGLRVLPNMHDSQPSNQAFRPGKRELERDAHPIDIGQAGRILNQPYISSDFEPDDIDVVLPDESLTAREREVLELLSRGLPNKLIARRLQISEHTVKFHVSSIYAKLGASSRTDAVSRGVRRGFITL